MTPPITADSARTTNRIIELRAAGMGWRAIGKAVGAARARWLRAKAGPKSRAAIRARTAAALVSLRAENRRLKATLRRVQAAVEEV